MHHLLIHVMSQHGVKPRLLFLCYTWVQSVMLCGDPFTRCGVEPQPTAEDQSKDKDQGRGPQSKVGRSPKPLAQVCGW